MNDEAQQLPVCTARVAEAYQSKTAVVIIDDANIGIAPEPRSF